MTGIYLALYAIGTITSAILGAFYLWVDQDPEGQGCWCWGAGYEVETDMVCTHHHQPSTIHH